MKHVGILTLVVVMCLAVVGVGYASWDDYLNINGDINTGNLDVQFSGAVSNDDGCEGVKDPDDDGSDPTEAQMAGVPVIRTMDVASTTAMVVDPGVNDPVGTQVTGLLDVTITNGYPSYYATVWYDILNAGSIPVHIAAITLDCEYTVVDADPDGNGVDGIDANGGLVTCEPILLDLDGDCLADIMLHLTGVSVCDVIDPGEEVQGDLHIHIEQDAQQGASLTFDIDFDFVNWNE
jgi:hypothetical protein